MHFSFPNDDTSERSSFLLFRTLFDRISEHSGASHEVARFRFPRTRSVFY